MRLVRIIDSESVRELCIKNGFYTRGDCRAYDYLLNNLCSDSGYSREVSDSDIEEIARDIVDHSNRNAFENLLDNISFLDCVRFVMFLLANDCCTTVVMDLYILQRGFPLCMV